MSDAFSTWDQEFQLIPDLAWICLPQYFRGKLEASCPSPTGDLAEGRAADARLWLLRQWMV